MSECISMFALGEHGSQKAPDMRSWVALVDRHISERC